MPKYYTCPACGKKKLVRNPLRIQCLNALCRYVNKTIFSIDSHTWKGMEQ